MEFPNKEYRQTMEDFHLESSNLKINNLNINLFGIFDGHSGFEVSKFCSENFTKYLIKEFSKYFLPNENQIIEILNNSFNSIDTDINKKCNFSNSVGSTATILLIYKNNYFCANVGDSKCYIIKKDNKISLITKDHNCLDEKETKRIKGCGGIIFNKRVFGTLMLTRTIGDKEMKEYGVISKPYIYYDNLNEINFIIIASDGVWDVINEEDLLELSKNCKESQVLCKKIMDLTRKRDSRDNISIFVINYNEI
jgi:serine/threonine protein phosphatase PrpC